MSEPNRISIGGVSFNKNDIKSSEVIKQDGKEMNSVFLRDGTHLVFPNQAEKNESYVQMTDKVEHKNGPVGYSLSKGKFGINYGVDPTMVDVSGKTVKTGDVSIDFYRMKDAQITGTEKADDYTLSGCRSSKVDVSQDDNKKDIVNVKDDDSTSKSFFGIKLDKSPQKHSKDKVFVSGNNQVNQNENDFTYIENDNAGIFERHWNTVKGKGTVQE